MFDLSALQALTPVTQTIGADTYTGTMEVFPTAAVPEPQTYSPLGVGSAGTGLAHPAHGLRPRPKGLCFAALNCQAAP